MSHTQPTFDPTLERRDPDHDLLKGLAVLLMIQVHVVELFATQELMDGWVGKASLFLGGAPVAPAFLWMFGFYALRAPVWPGQLLWRAIKLLFWGLLLNLGLNLHLLVRIFQGQLALDPLPYLLGVDILLLAGLSLIIITLLRPLLQQRAWGWLLTSLCVVTVSPWASLSITQWVSPESGWKWLAAFVALPTEWSYFPLFPWLCYPLLGVATFYGRSHLAAVQPRLKPLVMAAMFTLVITLPFAVVTSHQLSDFYHHGLLFFLWTSLFLLCWGWVLPRAGLPTSVTTWVAWFGQHVTACYVVQWLLIGNLTTAIYKTQSLAACLLWVLALVLLTRWLVSLWVQQNARAKTRNS